MRPSDFFDQADQAQAGRGTHIPRRVFDSPFARRGLFRELSTGAAWLAAAFAVMLTLAQVSIPDSKQANIAPARDGGGVFSAPTPTTPTSVWQLSGNNTQPNGASVGEGAGKAWLPAEMSWSELTRSKPSRFRADARRIR